MARTKGTTGEGGNVAKPGISPGAASDAADDVAQRVEAEVGRRRGRAQRPFPACPFQEALDFAIAMYGFGSGQQVRKVTLFDHLNRSPDSGPSRMLITNASKYGLTTGGYQAEILSLTPEGIKAVSEDGGDRERSVTRARLAVDHIAPFKAVYDKIAGTKLPARGALIDLMREAGVSDELVNEGVDTFISNLRSVGLLQTLSGADRVVTMDHLSDSIVESKPSQPFLSGNTPAPLGRTSALTTQDKAAFDKTCFYVTPIGDADSDARRHSDLFLGSIIEPALEEFGLTVIRADAIDKPGIITRQIFDYILRSRLVIADLSFHNPNVFYELALRHAVRLPVVQIIRSRDKVPFDINQMRTVMIDDGSIYSLLPRVEAYKSEIAGHVRRALDDPDMSDNPLTAYYPQLRVDFG